MGIVITPETARALAAYASVPIAFRTERVVDVEALAQSAGSRVESRVAAKPHIKDYDAYLGNSPIGWASRFDLGSWGLFAAHADGKRVGSAAVAMHDRAIEILTGRDDLALLFDLRVDPSIRRRGVGRALVGAVIEWARTNGARQLLVETQDINVPACRFYSKNGFVLDAVNPGAYSDFPDEVQLIWRRDLD